jgi:hypothetical protein
MTLSTEEENTVHLLKEEADAAGQYHLFEFWDKLDFEEKNKLIQSISKYRLLEIKEKFNNALQKMDNNKIPYKLEPVPSLNTQVVKNTSKEKLQEWHLLNLFLLNFLYLILLLSYFKKERAWFKGHH